MPLCDPSSGTQNPATLRSAIPTGQSHCWKLNRLERVKLSGRQNRAFASPWKCAGQQVRFCDPVATLVSVALHRGTSRDELVDRYHRCGDHGTPPWSVAADPNGVPGWGCNLTMLRNSCQAVALKLSATPPRSAVSRTETSPVPLAASTQLPPLALDLRDLRQLSMSLPPP